MREENGDTLRAVAWSEICPWLNIFRVFRIAIGFRVLALATIGLVLMVLVWGFIATVIGPSTPGTPVALDEPDPESEDSSLVEEEFAPRPKPTLYAKSSTTDWLALYREKNCCLIAEAVPDKPGLTSIPSQDIGRGEYRFVVVDSIVSVWLELTAPLRHVLDAKPRELACLLFFGLTSLAIWAFFGGAITRIASVELTCGERVPIMAAMRHACSKFWGYFTAPLVPLFGIVLLAIPIWFLGLIMNADFGVLLVSLVWVFALLAGLVMTLFLVGLLFGWPLMWATISTEGTDSFDALSRSYAYVFQRPLHFLFYTLVAALLGALGWLLVWNFAACITQLTLWSASWGCGTDRIENLDLLEGFGWAGAALLHFWENCVKCVAVGFIYGFFFVAASAIYLLLRRDVDATEMDEIYLDEDAGEEPFGLPPLATDATGAPVQEEAPKDEEAPKEEAPKEETDSDESESSDESTSGEGEADSSEDDKPPEEG